MENRILHITDCSEVPSKKLVDHIAIFLLHSANQIPCVSYTCGIKVDPVNGFFLQVAQDILYNCRDIFLVVLEKCVKATWILFSTWQITIIIQGTSGMTFCTINLKWKIN
eukprot:snap_masked-scaffold_7-processed-gene-19.34-mRNA-1 protein AED:1.00 eAED:1.00 QI:0/0/0/0/1/1/3/0/109